MSEPLITVNGQPFFGRVEEQQQFRATLEASLATSPGESLPFVLLLFGDGGIGKTTLARRFRDIVSSEYRDQFQWLWVDWEDERRRSPRLQVGREHIGAGELFDSLYAVALRQGWGPQFAQYQDALKDRAEAEQKAAEALSAVDERDDLADLRGASSTVIAKLVRLAAPIVGDAGENLVRMFADAGIKGGAEGLARLRAAATTRLKARLDPDKLDMFFYPDERLAGALAEGFRKIAETRPLIVFLDTYELVDRADHLLRMVIQRAGTRLLWVIGGRDNLLRSRQFGDDYYQGYADEWPRRLVHYDMRQLARADIRDYFDACVPDRSLDDNALAMISRATRGIPLAVREAADIWKARRSLEEIVGDIDAATPSAQIVRRMTERYQLHCLNDEADSRMLYALALAQGDIDLLRAMLQPGDGSVWSLDATLRRLERDYASVHREHARLHDDPAAFFREHLRDPIRRTEPWVLQLAQCAIVTLQHRIERLNVDLPLIEERCTDEDWLKAALDLTGYLFWQDEGLAWHWLVPRFVESLEYSQELRRGLLKVAESWSQWLSKGGTKRLKLLATVADAPLPRAARENEAALLDELMRLDRLGWLSGEGEEERRAILTLRRGRLCVQREQYIEAARLYIQVEQGLPETGQVLRRQLGEALDELAGMLLWPRGWGNAVFSAEAGELLTKAIEWLPEKPGIWYHLGVALRLAKKVEEAIAAFQQAIALDPKFAYPHNGLGNIYRNLGRKEEAIAAFQQAIALDPKFVYPHNGLGLAYRDLGRQEEAIAAYQQAIALDPKYATPYNGLGLVYRDMGRKEEAIAAFQQAIALDPKYVYPHNNLGNIYRDLGRREEAIAAFQQAIAIDPKYAVPYYNLGLAYRDMGRKEEAIAAYHQAITLDPKYAAPYFNLGRVYRDLGRIEEAIAAFQQAIALNPKYAAPHKHLGLVYRAIGRYDEALVAFTRVLEIEPENDWYFYSRGLTYRLAGNAQSADGDLAKAIAIASQTHMQAPDNWRNLFNLAIYHLAAGDEVSARRCYDEGLQGGAPPEMLRMASDDLTDLLALFPGYVQAESIRARLQDQLNAAGGHSASQP